MIALYPAVLVVVAVVLARNQGRPGGQGWRWYGAWAGAAALFAFSFLAGFSIGLFLLPAAAAALVAVASRAPGPAETLGFVAGVGLVGLLIALLNANEPGGPEAASWLAAGLALVAVATVAYAVARRA